jgi:hypothetical protein
MILRCYLAAFLMGSTLRVGVLFTDRMWFNDHHNKYLGTFDAQKKETKHLITGVNGIYAFADELKKSPCTMLLRLAPITSSSIHSERGAAMELP